VRKDKVYWLYQRQQLLERCEYLTEAERKLAEHNVNLITANRMANAGHSTTEIHEFLSQHPAYMTNSLEKWYMSGGDVPVVNYVRAAAIKAFGMNPQKIRSPLFEGESIHHNTVTPAMTSMMHAFQHHIKSVHEKLPDEITIYRGVGLHQHTTGNEYVPHALESWTTDIETARQFAHMSHLSNSIPHVFRATINKNHIFSSHLARPLVPHIIPEEKNLKGREEFIPFGDKLKNIERIE
jgi:hypothetical protein